MESPLSNSIRTFTLRPLSTNNCRFLVATQVAVKTDHCHPRKFMKRDFGPRQSCSAEQTRRIGSCCQGMNCSLLRPPGKAHQTEIHLAVGGHLENTIVRTELRLHVDLRMQTRKRFGCLRHIAQAHRIDRADRHLPAQLLADAENLLLQPLIAAQDSPNALQVGLTRPSSEREGASTDRSTEPQAILPIAASPG